jgi:DNA primase
VNRKTWRCWVCGVGGDAAELVKRINHCDFPAAVRFLADLSGVLPPLDGKGCPAATRPRRHQAFQPVARATVRLALGPKHQPSLTRPLTASGDLEARTLALVCMAVV